MGRLGAGMDRRELSVTEAAEFLGRGLNTVRRWLDDYLAVQAGDLPRDVRRVLLKGRRTQRGAGQRRIDAADAAVLRNLLARPRPGPPPASVTGWRW